MRFSIPGVCFRPLTPPTPTYEIALVARNEPSTTTTAFLRLANRPSRQRATQPMAA
jgi:hypothetical protein